MSTLLFLLPSLAVIFVTVNRK